MDKVEELESKLLAYQSLKPRNTKKRSFDEISDEDFSVYSEKSSSSVINGGKFSVDKIKLKRTVIVKKVDENGTKITSDSDNSLAADPLPTPAIQKQQRNFSVENPLGMSDDDDDKQEQQDKQSSSSSGKLSQLILKRNQKGTIK